MSVNRDRLLIMDDDPVFGKLACTEAVMHGFEPQWFASLIEMGTFAKIGNFDVVIFDYYLESMLGDEIAEYVDTFFAQVPVLMISGCTIDPGRRSRWPHAVHGFMSKDSGIPAIIEEARRILQRQRILRAWSGVGLAAET